MCLCHVGALPVTLVAHAFDPVGRLLCWTKECLTLLRVHTSSHQADESCSWEAIVVVHRANIKPEAFTTDALVDLPNVSCNTFMIWPTGDVRTSHETELPELLRNAVRNAERKQYFLKEAQWA